jgi:holdfast attachment protein HfaA
MTPMKFMPLALAGLALTGAATVTSATAADYSNSTNYNNPIGMSSGQENSTVNSSLRDENGNLTVVNGEITSSTFSQMGGVQNASASVSGVGSTSMNGMATAIGNSLNVVTTGSNNIVIVSSTQVNNGDQTANTNLNGQ